MARLARVVLPGFPHHVTQRGNGRATTFFGEQDYRLYRDLLVAQCRECGVGILGWCLMPNHVHLVLVPADADGLRRALSQVHRRYAGHIHARECRTGHFWQGRFGCVAMDEDHLVAALAYVALNPVRAGLVKRAQDWPWSSARALADARRDPGIVDVGAVSPYRRAVRDLVAAGEEDVRFEALRRAETIGRPVGDAGFFKRAETLTGRTLAPGKRGPKGKVGEDEN